MHVFFVLGVFLFSGALLLGAHAGTTTEAQHQQPQYVRQSDVRDLFFASGQVAKRIRFPSVDAVKCLGPKCIPNRDIRCDRPSANEPWECDAGDPSTKIGEAIIQCEGEYAGSEFDLVGSCQLTYRGFATAAADTDTSTTSPGTTMRTTTTTTTTTATIPVVPEYDEADIAAARLLVGLACLMILMTYMVNSLDIEDCCKDACRSICKKRKKPRQAIAATPTNRNVRGGRNDTAATGSVSHPTSDVEETEPGSVEPAVAQAEESHSISTGTRGVRARPAPSRPPASAIDTPSHRSPSNRQRSRSPRAPSQQTVYVHNHHHTSVPQPTAPPYIVSSHSPHSYMPIYASRAPPVPIPTAASTTTTTTSTRVVEAVAPTPTPALSLTGARSSASSTRPTKFTAVQAKSL